MDKITIDSEEYRQFYDNHYDDIELIYTNVINKYFQCVNGISFMKDKLSKAVANDTIYYCKSRILYYEIQLQELKKLMGISE